MELKHLTAQLNTFDRLLSEYEGSEHKEPLARFLTAFFKRNKQMGSNDRRRTSRWIYSYYRLGNTLPDSSPKERLVIAEYICHAESDLVLHQAPRLYASITLPLTEKIQILERDYAFRPDQLFPMLELASESLDKTGFLRSFFTQPDLFIRVVPKEKDAVLNVLQKKQIAYQEKDQYGIALANGTRLEQFRELVGKYQVQDLSSQRTGKYFEAHAGEQWWDACAASGGKSLLLWQTYPGVQILVSDIRPSMLRNLDERFEQAGLVHYRRKIIDLTKDPHHILGAEQFDGILLDIPCSGSGTWGRTPEMMRSFHREKLRYFVDLQRKIALNVISHLKVGCPLIYMTCSVYADENEKQVQFLEEYGLRLERMQLLEGYYENADTLFVARLIKSL